jgi:hypothetical protein
MIRTYTDLKALKTWEERIKYLKLDGVVGGETFGFDRYLNQMFYRSTEWKRVRRDIIIRDKGTDLGIDDREIVGKIYVHHMNPLEVKDIVDSTDYLLNPEFLICCSKATHDYIHYGVKSNVPKVVTERSPFDTSPWRKQK